jgi:hypothetical protein
MEQARWLQTGGLPDNLLRFAASFLRCLSNRQGHTDAPGAQVQKKMAHSFFRFDASTVFWRGKILLEWQLPDRWPPSDCLSIFVAAAALHLR